VSRFAVALGKSLNLPQEQLDTLDKGGLLHDIGKMAVPDAILLKPGTLTQEEFAIMKPHSMIGCSICERLRSAKDALPLIRNHHEKLDGSGYPDGLKGDEISLLVRLITVVDIYDALTSQRSYKSAWTNEETFRIMYEEVKRGWWDGDLVRAWEKFIQSGAMGPLLYQKHLEPGITIIKRAIL
jgi:putative two-component system response regulator